MISRQRKWQLKKVKEGKCPQCGKPLDGNTKLCIKCNKTNRKTKYGIPFDEPLRGKGRPRKNK